MAEQNIKKIYRNRVGMEDLSLGTGTETQTRNGQAVTITKVNASLLPYDDTRTLDDVYNVITESETNAKASEDAAKVSEDNAKVSENNAKASEDNAKASEDNAKASEDAAKTSEDNAAASYDSFDDRYLGAKSSEPTLDNDGDALLIGALYFNTSTSSMKVWSGTAWEDSYVSLSAALLKDQNLGDLDNINTAKTNLELNNVDNTSDLNKPVSTATTTAINNSKSVSKVASSVLLNKDSLALDNSVITKSNANITYTGNGGTQDIVTGISSVDFTVVSNGSGYYHDRVSGDCIVKNDAGTVVESGSAVVNTSKNEIKCRTVAHGHWWFDGVRGGEKGIGCDVTGVEQTLANLSVSFNTNSITVNSRNEINQSGATYILHQTLYTHIKWGLTSQGKRYITAYNPVTREVMTMYQGSGVAGHQIPNPLGIKLDYLEIKNLDGVTDWVAGVSALGGGYLVLNSTVAFVPQSNGWYPSDENTKDVIVTGVNNIADNTLNSSYMIYGFANSETKIITQYQGTGAAGNFVETKDVNGVAKKPSRIIRKSTSGVDNWTVWDYKRNDFDGQLFLNLSNSEGTTDYTDVYNNGFTLKSNGYNESGWQYIAIVEFDTTSSNDDTYFDLPTDDTNLTLVNGKLVFTDGRASNGGYNVSTQDFTGSIDFTGISDGIKYVGLDEAGNTVAYDGVAIGLYDKESADDNRLVFDTKSGKWHTTTGGELVTNGTFDTDVSGWYDGGDGSYTLSLVNNTMKILRNTPAGVRDASQTIVTEVGEEYVFTLYINVDNADIGRVRIDDVEIGSITSSSVFSYKFVAQSVNTKISFAISNDVGDYILVDNISVYKKEATLDTPLTSPICFIDDKPYQITSETPMDRLEDYPSMPKNIIEDTSISNLTITDGFDLGQSWVDVISERALDVTYKNETGKPMFISIQGGSSTATQVFVDGIRVGFTSNFSGGQVYFAYMIVPDGSEYYATGGSLVIWAELK